MLLVAVQAREQQLSVAESRIARLSAANTAKVDKYVTKVVMLPPTPYNFVNECSQQNGLAQIEQV